MKRLLCLLGFVGALLWPVAAFAHPLGNFTVNRYSRLELADGRLRVRYVLDMAEIPTFQERPLIDGGYAARKAAELAAGAHLSVDGAAVPLAVSDPELSFLDGQGGLQTLRLTAWFNAPLNGTRIAYEDTNYRDRIGWSEIVLPGGRDVSHELLSYPDDLLSSPLDQHTASFTIDGAGSVASSRVSPLRQALDLLVAGQSGISRAKDAFAGLIDPAELSAAVIAFSLLSALVLGALHGLSPGHGKTVVAAYLVGSRGTPWQAVVLGLTVTATHTLGVFALGLATLLASKYVLPEQLYPWLGAASGALVLVIGLGLLIPRARLALLGAHSHDEHAHGHETPGHHHAHASVPVQDHGQAQASTAGDAHAYVSAAGHEHEHAQASMAGHEHEHAQASMAGHEHASAQGRMAGHEHASAQGSMAGHEHASAHVSMAAHEHSHEHVGAAGHEHAHAHGDAGGRTPAASPGLKRILALGVSGGLLPCPSALVVLLSAISLHRVGFGLVLIVAFSLGLASVLTGVGLLLVYAGGLFRRVEAPPRLALALPAVSALVVVLAGAAIGLQGLSQAGVVAF